MSESLGGISMVESQEVAEESSLVHLLGQHLVVAGRFNNAELSDHLVQMKLQMKEIEDQHQQFFSGWHPDRKNLKNATEKYLSDRRVSSRNGSPQQESSGLRRSWSDSLEGHSASVSPLNPIPMGSKAHMAQRTKRSLSTGGLDLATPNTRTSQLHSVGASPSTPCSSSTASSVQMPTKRQPGSASGGVGMLRPPRGAFDDASPSKMEVSRRTSRGTLNRLQQSPSLQSSSSSPYLSVPASRKKKIRSGAAASSPLQAASKRRVSASDASGGAQASLQKESAKAALAAALAVKRRALVQAYSSKGDAAHRQLDQSGASTEYSTSFESPQVSSSKSAQHSQQSPDDEVSSSFHAASPARLSEASGIHNSPQQTGSGFRAATASVSSTLLDTPEAVVSDSDASDDSSLLSGSSAEFAAHAAATASAAFRAASLRLSASASNADGIASLAGPRLLRPQAAPLYFSNNRQIGEGEGAAQPNARGLIPSLPHAPVAAATAVKVQRLQSDSDDSEDSDGLEDEVEEEEEEGVHSYELEQGLAALTFLEIASSSAIASTHDCTISYGLSVSGLTSRGLKETQKCRQPPPFDAPSSSTPHLEQVMATPVALPSESPDTGPLDTQAGSETPDAHSSDPHPEACSSYEESPDTTEQHISQAQVTQLEQQRQKLLLLQASLTALSKDASAGAAPGEAMLRAMAMDDSVLFGSPVNRPSSSTSAYAAAPAAGIGASPLSGGSRATGSGSGASSGAGAGIRPPREDVSVLALYLQSPQGSKVLDGALRTAASRYSVSPGSEQPTSRHAMDGHHIPSTAGLPPLSHFEVKSAAAPKPPHAPPRTPPYAPPHAPHAATSVKRSLDLGGLLSQLVAVAGAHSLSDMSAKGGGAKVHAGVVAGYAGGAVTDEDDDAVRLDSPIAAGLSSPNSEAMAKLKLRRRKQCLQGLKAKALGSSYNAYSIVFSEADGPPTDYAYAHLDAMRITDPGEYASHDHVASASPASDTSQDARANAAASSTLQDCSSPLNSSAWGLAASDAYTAYAASSLRNMRADDELTASGEVLLGHGLAGNSLSLDADTEQRWAWLQQSGSANLLATPSFMDYVDGLKHGDVAAPARGAPAQGHSSNKGVHAAHTRDPSSAAQTQDSAAAWSTAGVRAAWASSDDDDGGAAAQSGTVGSALRGHASWCALPEDEPSHAPSQAPPSDAPSAPPPVRAPSAALLRLKQQSIQRHAELQQLHAERQQHDELRRSSMGPMTSSTRWQLSPTPAAAATAGSGAASLRRRLSVSVGSAGPVSHTRAVEQHAGAAHPTSRSPRGYGERAHGSTSSPDNKGAPQKPFLKRSSKAVVGKKVDWSYVKPKTVTRQNYYEAEHVSPPAHRPSHRHAETKRGQGSNTGWRPGGRLPVSPVAAKHYADGTKAKGARTPSAARRPKVPHEAAGYSYHRGGKAIVDNLETSVHDHQVGGRQQRTNPVSPTVAAGRLADVMMQRRQQQLQQGLQAPDSPLDDLLTHVNLLLKDFDSQFGR